MSTDENAVGKQATSEPAGRGVRVRVDLAWLDEQCVLRGWMRKRTLAEKIGVREETISDLYREASTSRGTWEKLRDALHDNPPDELSSLLLGAASEPTEGAA